MGNELTYTSERRLTCRFRVPMGGDVALADRAAVEPGFARRKESRAAATHKGLDDSALGALAMLIVHDLRNPLAAIYSGAEILAGPPLPEQQVQRLAHNMYGASIRIKELLEDYVDRCRTGEGRLHPSSLRNLIAHSVDKIAALAEAQSVVVMTEIPEDQTVTLDRSRIGSVLSNLLTNAIEAMPEGGVIRISVSAGDSRAVIRVRDTGPGVAPEIRDRLFQPFVTARKQNGWGLGLAQAHRVVVNHGGEMWLEAVAGQGACFAFSLPA